MFPQICGPPEKRLLYKEHLLAACKHNILEVVALYSFS